MEWRTDEPPKTGRILAAVEEWSYRDYGWEPVAFVSGCIRVNRWGEDYWALDDETPDYPPTPVKFTKWMPFPEYPQ